jgi:magnesium-transporting ATPase (P-type)
MSRHCRPTRTSRRFRRRRRSPRFILFIGPISSIFDYTTFFVMLWVFNCWDPSHASLFQTGWFVESLMTQTLIIHVIRTNKIPFLQSRARWSLTITTLSIMAFGVWRAHRRPDWHGRRGRSKATLHR